MLGYVTASLFNGLEDTKHAVKYNFSNGIYNSPKLNVALNLPQDNAFNSVDYLIKNELRNKFEETIDGIVKQLTDTGNESIRYINQFKLLVISIFSKLLIF